MNRDEILRQLNYKGKYTKEVKKRLNKFLKKYHPDNNKEDKKTILILYEIKKELESGTLEYKESSNVEVNKKKTNKQSSITIMFLESMIERLNIQKEKINKKINNIYKKINLHYEKQSNKQDELSFIEFEIKEMEEELEELLKIDIIDKTIMIFIMLFIFLSIGFRNVFILLIVFIFVLFEIYYIYIRSLAYKEKKNRLVKSVEVLKNVKNEFDVLEERVLKLEKEELKLKKERSRINNDIQYYSHEISKINEKEYEDKYTKDNINDKAYIKK